MKRSDCIILSDTVRRVSDDRHELENSHVSFRILIGKTQVYKLRKITIPKSVVYIDECCFMHNFSLQQLKFESESQLKGVGAGALNGTGLRFISFPRSVKWVGKRCFARCRFLESVSFEAGSVLECIDCESFLGCSNLKFIDFGYEVRLEDPDVLGLLISNPVKKIEIVEHFLTKTEAESLFDYKRESDVWYQGRSCQRMETEYEVRE